MKKLWKSLFVAFAAVSLAGCSLQDLMFWKKSSEPEQQQKEEEKKEDKPSEGGEVTPEPQPEPEPEPQPEPEPVENLFPVKEALAFFDAAGIDVVIPAYVSEANDFEIDDTDPAAFVIYANNSSAAEMGAFKDALVAEGWVVLSEVEGDFVLGFGETAARVSLVAFDDYVGIAFSVYSEPTGLSPEEAITEIASYWGGLAQEVQEGVFGAYGAFSAASYSVDDMKNFVSSLFVPEEFELVSDWEEAEDGTNSCIYANAVLTVLEIYVYGETLYVDGDGRIVDEGTEGATAVEATCIEVYSYTYSE